MPGYANWKDLFALQYLQLYAEVYPVGDSTDTRLSARTCLTLYENPLIRLLDRIRLGLCLQLLVGIRDQGIRSGFSFC